jgi:uncharacterized protein YcgL (UPF0745 family)
MKKLFCTIYKSTKKDETYLYVDHKNDLKGLPAMLLNTFGTPILVTKMILTSEKKLARAEVEKVISEVMEKGFYLQLPPKKEDYLLDLHDEYAKSAHDTYE